MIYTVVYADASTKLGWRRKKFNYAADMVAFRDWLEEQNIRYYISSKED